MLVYFMIGVIIHILLILCLLFVLKKGFREGIFEGGKEEWDKNVRLLIETAVTSPVLIALSILLWPLTLAITATLFASVIQEYRP